MPDTPTEQSRARVLAQQTVLARFGEMALHADDLGDFLHEACHLLTEALGTDLAKVLELQPDGRHLLVRAGVGWSPGIIGTAIVSAGRTGSCAGFALSSGEPVISPVVAEERRFGISAFVREHGVQSLANAVVIGADGRPPYGVIEVSSRQPCHFSAEDGGFLRTYANMLAAAVERLRAEAEVRSRAQDNERLLRELQHRVKNNLQVIVGLVRLQQRRAAEPETQQALLAVSQRVDALRLLHDKLYVSGEVDRLDLGAYLAEVAGTLLRFHEDERTRVRLVLETKEVICSPEQAAPLGLLVNEFIDNSLKHAFEGERGSIGLRLEPAKEGAARLTLWDDGKGLPLECSGGTGMRMIDGLARQLATRTEWSRGRRGGARLSLLLRRPGRAGG